MQKTLVIIRCRPLQPEAVRTSAWLVLFAIVIIAAILAVSYLEGGLDESLRESRDISEEIAALRVQNRDLQERYDLLADSSGEAAILEAGIRFDEKQEAHQ